YLPGISRKLEWLSEEDLLKRVISLEFNRLLDYYKDAPKIDFIDAKPERKGKKKGEGHERPADDSEKDRRTASKGMERIYVNVGKRDGFFAGNLIEMLNRLVQGKRVDVGRIDLLPSYSLFDVRKSDARKVVGALTGADFFGKRLHSEIADKDRDYSKIADKRKNNKKRQ
ncbi:MAG: ATP-dependent helicase, partial [Muribaculaceae bacterium]|nr:ATP-dependent helicase [Muribaculaceae bacterium]